MTRSGTGSPPGTIWEPIPLVSFHTVLQETEDESDDGGGGRPDAGPGPGGHATYAQYQRERLRVAALRANLAFRRVAGGGSGVGGGGVGVGVGHGLNGHAGHGVGVGEYHRPPLVMTFQDIDIDIDESHNFVDTNIPPPAPPPSPMLLPSLPASAQLTPVCPNTELPNPSVLDLAREVQTLRVGEEDTIELEIKAQTEAEAGAETVHFESVGQAISQLSGRKRKPAPLLNTWSTVPTTMSPTSPPASTSTYTPWSSLPTTPYGELRSPSTPFPVAAEGDAPVEGQRQSYPLHAPGTGLGLTLTPSAPSASTSSAGGTYVPGSVSSPTFAFPPTPGSETEADAQFMDVDNEPKRPPTRRARFCTSGKWFAGQM